MTELRTFDASGTTLQRSGKVFTITCVDDKTSNRVATQLRTEVIPDAAQPTPLTHDALIEIIMRETTDKIVADGWEKLGNPNVLVQGCKFVRRHIRSDPTEGYANPDDAARKFAGFIADAILAAQPPAAPVETDQGIGNIAKDCREAAEVWRTKISRDASPETVALVYERIAQSLEVLAVQRSSAGNDDLETIYAALDQAQDCIRGETPEDVSDQEAREDTIDKVRDAMRLVEHMQAQPQGAGK